MEEYLKTPSFYNTDEVFKKYLGLTSYYVTLQNCVSKITKIIKPDNVLELGSGTGATSIRLALENPLMKVTSVDMREEMIEVSRKNALSIGVNNVVFIQDEMVGYVSKQKNLPNFIVLMYSFHHVEDPIDKKINFLKECYAKLPKDAIICIAETFLPETSNEVLLESSLRTIWSNRLLEAYASTFWASLESLDLADINKSKDIGNFSKDNELKAGELVIKRNNEYLISVGAIKKIAVDIGFKVILAEPCNCVNEYIVILGK